MGEEAIMEAEKKKMVYFHLEEGRSLKKHFFQAGEVKGMSVAVEEGYGLLLYPVPEFHIHGRRWNKEKLLEMLGGVLRQPDVTEYYIQPELCRMLELREKLPPELLLRKVLKQNPCWEYLLLIGNGWEEDEPLLPLLREYLPRINHFTVITDKPAEYAAFAEYIYEEYGIPTACSAQPERRQGKKKRTVILDNRRCYKPPFTVLPEEAFYIDCWSGREKRSLLEAKRRDVRYLSAVKFLDTLAENGYNTIVNQT